VIQYIHTECMYIFARGDITVARNKYPEETRIKILKTAKRLFLEKGAPNTTVQDILDNLDGLSKGAIYHHFKNKEELETAVYEYIDYDGNGRIREKIVEIGQDGDLNAIEKLVQILLAAAGDPYESEFRRMAPDIKKNPRFLSEQMDRWINVDTREFFLPVIGQAIREGSIQTKYPKQFSEMLSLISNVWMNTTLYPVSTEEYRDKIMFCIELLEKLNIHVGIDKEALDVILRFQTDTEKD